MSFKDAVLEHLNPDNFRDYPPDMSEATKSAAVIIRRNWHIENPEQATIAKKLLKGEPVLQDVMEPLMYTSEYDGLIDEDLAAMWYDRRASGVADPSFLDREYWDECLNRLKL